MFRVPRTIGPLIGQHGGHRASNASIVSDVMSSAAWISEMSA